MTQPTTQNTPGWNTIPPLDRTSLGLLLRSVAQTELSRISPLSMMQQEDAAFFKGSWQEQQISPELAALILRAYAGLLGLDPGRIHPCETPGELLDQAWDLWSPGERAIVFRTSGSTGTPKPCMHPEQALQQECAAILPLLGNAARVLATVPLHHSFGFAFGLYAAKGLGVPLRISAPLPQLLRTGMRKGDIVVSIPFCWSRLIQGPELDGQGITLVSATAPLPDAVMATLIGWGFRCIDIFGSSETGALCHRENPQTPFRLFPQFTFPAEEHVSHTIRRTLPSGEELVLPLMDNIVRQGERELTPQGRVDAAVQVAGQNVYPARIAALLSEVEGVAECAVRLMPPDEGDRLHAFVVPREGSDHKKILAALREQARKRLAPPERPAAYAFGTALPRNAMGKLTNW